METKKTENKTVNYCLKRMDDNAALLSVVAGAHHLILDHVIRQDGTVDALRKWFEDEYGKKLPEVVKEIERRLEYVGTYGADIERFRHAGEIYHLRGYDPKLQEIFLQPDSFRSSPIQAIGIEYFITGEYSFR